jgi:hypothetical protein
MCHDVFVKETPRQTKEVTMSKTAQKHYFAGLVGKTIKHVAYLDKGQIEEDFGWYCDEDETTVIVFTDGTAAILMADPEGNGPGWMEVTTVA